MIQDPDFYEPFTRYRKPETQCHKLTPNTAFPVVRTRGIEPPRP